MATFDRRFVRPSRHDLMEAFTEAARAANGEWNILSVDDEHWREEVARLPRGGEGHLRFGSQNWPNSHAVQFWWWTDRHGGRHCRLRGDEDAPQADDPRPSFWHVYPERAYYRAPISDTAGWWVVCACGAAGEPLAVGWTGSMCAACHDRQQDGEPIPANLPLPAFLPHGSYALADPTMVFSPDGRSLAAAFPSRTRHSVRITELDTGGHRDLGDGMKGSRALAYSADGRLLAHTGGPSRLLVTEVATGAVLLDQEVPGLELASLAFAPHGLGLAAGGPDGVQVWERQHRDGPWELRHTISFPVCALAFSPGSEYLALGGAGALRLYDLPGTALVERPLLTYPAPHAAYQLAFQTDSGTTGQLTVLVGSHSLNSTVWRRQHGERAVVPDDVATAHDPAEVVVLRLSGPQADTVVRHPMHRLSWGALCPTGRWLAWSFGSEWENHPIRLMEVLPGEERGQVAWDLRSSPGHFALSSFEAGMLAITDGGGKLIPWRLLLGI